MSARTGRVSNARLAILIGTSSGLRKGDIVSWWTAVRRGSIPGIDAWAV